MIQLALKVSYYNTGQFNHDDCTTP
jgi:hypothetical protein